MHSRNYYVFLYYSTQQTPESSSSACVAFNQKINRISKSGCPHRAFSRPLCWAQLQSNSRARSPSPPEGRGLYDGPGREADSWLERSRKKNSYKMRADHRLSAGCLSPGRQQLESSGGLKLLKGSEVIQLFAAKRQEGPLTLPRLRFRLSQRSAEAKLSTVEAARQTSPQPVWI